MDKNPESSSAGLKRKTGRCLSVELEGIQWLHSQRQSRQPLPCDAVIRTDDGGAFPVHRAVMSASSPYFLALFTTSLHVREQNDVTITGVRPEMLLLLLEYAYLGRVNHASRRVNVHELLMTADYLDFPGVLQLCCGHLHASMLPSNCLGVMMFARRLSCYNLEIEARLFVLRNFEAVAEQSEELLHLTLEELESLVREDELDVCSQEAVREAVVMRWIDLEPELRRPHIVKLIASTELGLRA